MVADQRLRGRRVLTDRQLNTAPIPEETYMLCPLCSHEEWVSPEDSDASMSEMVHHFGYRHELYGQAAWGPPMTQVLVVAPESL